MRYAALVLSALVLLSLAVPAGTVRAQSHTFVVNSTGDTPDANPGDGIAADAGGQTTLRAAIMEANAIPGTVDRIHFNIPGSPPFTIRPASALPTITDPVIIDGTTQPGFAGTPMIEIDGTNAGSGTDGLRITAGGSTVRGLVINRFQGNQQGHGIELSVSGNNTIEGNFIGTDVTGMTDQGNKGSGIYITNSGSNRIGGTTAAQRNVISGNDWGGINISVSTNDIITGNYIGTKVNGTAALGNSFGVGTGDGTRVGGTAPGEGNVISGNARDGYSNGISISGSNGAIIQGNFIGTNASGTASLGNDYNGIWIGNGARNNLIGGTVPAARNIISGNYENGIMAQLISPADNNNRIHGNYIGTDVTGSLRLGNFQSGVHLEDVSYIRIGGTGPGEGNLISGNSAGITIYDNSFGPSTNNMIEGNLIGTNATGTGALANGYGVSLSIGAEKNTVGGTSPGARNIISGNSVGISIGGDENVVQGNYIGVDISGVAPLGNTSRGVDISPPYGGGDRNIIGGTVPAAANVIAYNGVGVSATGNPTYGNPTQNAITGNSIYLNTGVGINLGTDNVTPNDALDPDTGPNNYQNYPVLTSVVREGWNTRITGNLNSLPSSQFRLEFFMNTTADASGYGEGEVYVGTTNVTTDAAGDATFDLVRAIVPVPTQPNHKVTATATSSDNDTSEFSASIPILVVLTNVTENVTGTSAVLSGNLASLGTTGTVNVSFQWGTSPGAYPSSTTVQALSAPGTFSYSLTGLTPGMTHFFRARAVGNGTSYGIERSFTTPVEYTLTINVVGNGTTVPAPGTHTYVSGTSVNVTATPAANWRFSGWSGDVTDNATTITVIMNANKSLTASFAYAGPWYVGPTGSDVTGTGTSSNPFATIQKAVDTASAGDTVIVMNGTYIQNVNVTKTLTVESQNGAEVTRVIAANTSDHVFEVTANYTTIRGFTAYGARHTGVSWEKAAIYLSQVSNSIVENNYCGVGSGQDNDNGIHLYRGSNNQIINNRLVDNDEGIYLQGSDNNTIAGNFIRYSEYYDIHRAGYLRLRRQSLHRLSG